MSYTQQTIHQPDVVFFYQSDGQMISFFPIVALMDLPCAFSQNDHRGYALDHER